MFIKRNTKSFRRTGHGNQGQSLTLEEVANEVSARLISIFQRDVNSHRPVLAGNELFENDAHWRDLIPFHEDFHGDFGAGVGASHQTGWTALVANLISDLSEAQAAHQATWEAGK